MTTMTTAEMRWRGCHGRRTCIVEFMKQYVPEILTSPGYNRPFSPSDAPHGWHWNMFKERARAFGRDTHQSGHRFSRPAVLSECGQQVSSWV
jgi:hypothetical protein